MGGTTQRHCRACCYATARSTAAVGAVAASSPFAAASGPLAVAKPWQAAGSAGVPAASCYVADAKAVAAVA